MVEDGICAPFGEWRSAAGDDSLGSWRHSGGLRGRNSQERARPETGVEGCSGTRKREVDSHLPRLPRNKLDLARKGYGSVEEYAQPAKGCSQLSRHQPAPRSSLAAPPGALQPHWPRQQGLRREASLALHCPPLPTATLSTHLNPSKEPAYPIPFLFSLLFSIPLSHQTAESIQSTGTHIMAA